MTDEQTVSTAPKTFKGDDWNTLSSDDRAWHHRRDALIQSGHANGGRVFLSRRQRAEFQITPDDLLPSSGPVRLVEPEDDPADRESDTLAAMAAPVTLPDITSRLDEVETRAASLGKRLSEARRVHREESSRIAALGLSPSANAEMKDRADDALREAEREIQADAEALATQASGTRADLSVMNPPASISKQVATEASGYLPHVSAEAALMTPAQLVARVRGVVAQGADEGLALAWLTVGRQRLATLDPTDTVRYDLQQAIRPVADRFTDTDFAASQGAALNRVENGVGKIQADIRRAQQERGVFPEWLGDLNRSDLKRAG